jgi:tetratricopeptide (TPR) repeat protein
MSQQSEESMQLGHAARRAGRTAEALEHYRAATRHDPGHAESHSVYGLMLLQLGRAGEAEAPLRRAVEIAPKHPALQMNLAQWLAEQGRAEEAERLVASVVEGEPGHWWAWDRLGELKLKLQKIDEAAECYRRAGALRPQARLAGANLVALQQQAGFHESKGNWAALEKAARSWIALQPRDPEAWRSLARGLMEVGQYARAMDAFRQGLAVGVRSAEGLAAYARLCMSALEFDTAAKALEEAETLDPDSASMASAKASWLLISGDYEGAQAYCRRAIAGNRKEAVAYRTLAQLTGGRLAGADLSGLESLVAREDLGPDERATAAFALAACRDAQAADGEAFAAYDLANRLAREAGRANGFTYDAAARVARTDRIMSLFGAVADPVPRDAEPRIIFIVGMPRSGTTLIESVVGAHSRVFTGGERMAVRWIMEELLSGAEAWDAWRQSVWQGFPEAHRASVLTDKNPWNFDAIGLILRLLPEARIVHVRRNPLDTGLSIYQNQFSRHLQFANRLEDIGHYYGEYARLMAHWEKAAAGRFVTVQYEEFVRDFDESGPALLAACGLDWEPACRNFWEKPRVIGTMSTMQARRPLESRAGRAHRYIAELAPLTESLRAAGVDLETGALRAKLGP